MKRLGLFLQLAVVCTLADGIASVRPGAEWILNGDTYAGLQWLDTVQTKPTLSEIQTAQTACLSALTPAGILSKQRSDAITELNAGVIPSDKLQRAVFLVALDEINLLRERDVDRATDVAASTSLADLKTRWAARASLSDRTAQQFKNAVENKITSGASD